jgi:hypothetical protein
LAGVEGGVVRSGAAQEAEVVGYGARTRGHPGMAAAILLENSRLRSGAPTGSSGNPPPTRT